MAIAIHTRTTDENLVGKSHWWGAPDLPEEVPFPYVTLGEGDEEYYEPLTFICQIKLSDIAALDHGNLLPHSGMLYFFAPLDYFMGEYETEVDYHDAPVVIYSPEEEGLQPYSICWEGTDESIFRPAEAIDFSAVMGDTVDGHILLGKPYQDEITDEHPDCLSLLQIDEDDRWNLRFFDCGMYYFLINPQHLAHRQWDKVEGALFYY